MWKVTVFQFICTTFPGLSYDKIKAGVFDGTQIKKLMKCQNFSSSMTDVEKRAWNAFVAVVKGFFGNTKAANYKDLVETLLDSFHVFRLQHEHKGSFPQEPSK